MRHLLNTLFVTSEDIYLSLDGENVVGKPGKKGDGQQLSAPYAVSHPLLFLPWSFSGFDGSMCAARHLNGFLHATGEIPGPNHRGSQRKCVLRRTQYRIADDPKQSCVIARAMVFGKVHNADGSSSALAGTMAFGWMTGGCGGFWSVEGHVAPTLVPGGPGQPERAGGGCCNGLF